MAKGNPLQEQLLKAGLVKKSKLAEAVRDQQKARAGKGPSQADELAQAAERTRAEKAERDRALQTERKAQARAAELRAQARQIIADKQLPAAGTLEYRFTADGVIRTVLVDAERRAKLAVGALVIVRAGEGFALLPRAAGEKVRERDATMIVLDHGASDPPPKQTCDDDDYYARFKVPDDLVW